MKKAYLAMQAALAVFLLCPMVLHANPEENKDSQLLFDIDFEGGDVPAYLETIKRITGADNIQYNECELNDFMLPPIHLTQTSLGKAISQVRGKRMFIFTEATTRLYRIDLKGTHRDTTNSTFKDANLYKIYRQMASREEREEPTVPFDVHYKGGNAAEFMDYVQEVSNIPNLIYDREQLKDIIIPPIELTGVTIQMLFESLSEAPLSAKNGSSNNYIAFEISRPRGNVQRGALQSIYNVYTQITPQQVDVLEFRRFSESGYKIEDVAGAIELALEMADKAGDIEIKLHEPTQILMVRGTKWQLQYVRKVLESLPLKNEREPGTPIVPLKVGEMKEP